MKRILFVCHGNICRSPMAEFIMKRLVRRAGREEEFSIASAATSDEELGNPVYPMARQALAEHGIGCPGKVARRLTEADYADYDLLVGMDQQNLAAMRSILGQDEERKLSLLLDHLPEGHPRRGHDIADPWYTRNFRAAWDDIYCGCNGLLDELCSDGRASD